MNDCVICKRISRIQRGDNPYFVKELETGFVVIGDEQLPYKPGTTRYYKPGTT